MSEMTNRHAPLPTERTEGTQGTSPEITETQQFPEENTSGYSENPSLSHIQSNDPPENAPTANINRSAFCTHEEWFSLNGQVYKPGLYWHGWTKPRGNAEPEPLEIWVCTPINIIAITANERGESFGLLLRFVNPYNEWIEWAAPMYLLKGSGEELRGELLNMGVRLDIKNRQYLLQWMMESFPEKRIIAALKTGWHNDSFVLPNCTIGNEDIRFQSEHVVHNNFITSGSLEQWRLTVSQSCNGNPLLLLSLSTAFLGPLIKHVKLQETGGVGIHLVGDSSQGKTTALQVAASVWGSPGFVRTWRATANGLEAVASALNDTLLVLDEISECDPREIGAIVYAISNGTGKQRAARTGGMKESAHWRCMLLSSGERSLSAHMSEGGKRIKAGQEVRLLDVPATNQTYGLFDELHNYPDGRSFADALKQSTNKHYGHAGKKFLESLINDKRDLTALYAKTSDIPEFSGRDGVQQRAASTFTLIGFAGELATEYGITGWEEGAAINAAITAYKNWQDFRGEGQTETRQILNSINEFILRHGDSRFTPISDNGHNVRERAGYWRDVPSGRVYFFNSPSLKEAAAGFDLRRVLDALESEGWIVEHDIGKRSKKIKVGGSAVSLYAIRPVDEDEK